jgi:hypothetical protein
MNASRPEADAEYSRAHRASGQAEVPLARPRTRDRATVLALGLAGAALLVAAELSPLLRVRTIAAHPHLVRTVQTGPHHAWALLPIAVLALALSAYFWRSGRRLALVAIAVLGAVALVVALAADLPDAHATGLVGSPATGLHNAQAHAAAGLYLETLGAVVLGLAAAAGGLLGPHARRETRGPPTARDRGLR